MFGLDWFFGLLTGVFHWLQQQLSNYGIDLSTLDVAVKFKDLWQYMKVANDCVPLADSFKILFNGFAVKAGIRAVRWILSCIPGSNQ